MATDVSDSSATLVATLLDSWFSDYALFHETPPRGSDKQALIERSLRRVNAWQGFRNVCRKLAEWIDGLSDPRLDSAPLWFLSGCAPCLGVLPDVPGDTWTAAWVLCNRLRSRIGAPEQAATAQIIAKRIEAAAEVASEATGTPQPVAASDDTAYVPAIRIWRDRFDNYKAAKKFLDKHPEIRTRKPGKQRLTIHAGDWTKYWATQNDKCFDALDSSAPPEITSIVADGAKARYDKVHAEKQRQPPRDTPPLDRLVKRIQAGK